MLNEQASQPKQSSGLNVDDMSLAGELRYYFGVGSKRIHALIERCGARRLACQAKRERTREYLKARDWRYLKWLAFDWAVRLLLAMVLVYLGIVACYAAKFGLLAQGAPLIPQGFENVMERGGTVFYPVCFMLAGALLLPLKLVRLIAVALLLVFVVAGGPIKIYGWPAQTNPYRDVALVHAPENFDLAKVDVQLWPYGGFAPNPVRVAGERMVNRFYMMGNMLLKGMAQEAGIVPKMMGMSAETMTTHHLPPLNQVESLVPGMNQPAVIIKPKSGSPATPARKRAKPTLSPSSQSGQ